MTSSAAPKSFQSQSHHLQLGFYAYYES